MEEFKVGCSPLTSKIFAGKVSKNGLWGKVKHDITDTAVGAVAQHLLQLDAKMEFVYDGETYELKVEKLTPYNPLDQADDPRSMGLNNG